MLETYRALKEQQKALENHLPTEGHEDVYDHNIIDIDDETENGKLWNSVFIGISIGIK